MGFFISVKWFIWEKSASQIFFGKQFTVRSVRRSGESHGSHALVTCRSIQFLYAFSHLLSYPSPPCSVSPLCCVGGRVLSPWILPQRCVPATFGVMTLICIGRDRVLLSWYFCIAVDCRATRLAGIAFLFVIYLNSVVDIDNTCGGLIVCCCHEYLCIRADSRATSS